MLHEKYRHLPPGVKSPDTLMGASRHTEVYGYDVPPVVLKASNGKIDRSFSTYHSAKESAREVLRERDVIRDEIMRIGGDANIVPAAEAVIHQDIHNEGVTYSLVEEKITGRTLETVGDDLYSLSDEQLLNLQRIFQASIRHKLDTGDMYDTHGTTSHQLPIHRKIMKALYPLNYSSNIMIDDDNNPSYIDASIVNMQNKSVMQKAVTNLQLVGSAISVCTLYGIRKARPFFKRD